MRDKAYLDFLLLTHQTPSRRPRMRHTCLRYAYFAGIIVLRNNLELALGSHGSVRVGEACSKEVTEEKGKMEVGWALIRAIAC
jgi:hypothetical protein